MSQHNPELQPTERHNPHDALQPGAPDFVETPDVTPTVTDREPMPLWLYLVCGLALFLAGSSFTGFGVFGSGLYDQGQSGPAITSTKGSEAAAVTDPVALGKKVYGGNCANCHQASGEGQPGSYPPMVGSEWVLGSKERLAAIMLHGVSGPLTVKGGSYGSQQMPGWSGSLTDDKIANVMTYLRKSWGNTGDEVKTEDVTAARTKFSSQSAAYTQDQLLKIAPNDKK